MRSAPRITLYSTSRCPHCSRVREFLRRRGLRFQELDVQNNVRAQKALARLGARAVPVVMIGDEAVHGFDAQRLTTLLDAAKSR